jgi:5,10-methylenetetrahydromethanopterin reductase
MVRKIGLCFTGGPYTVQQTTEYVRLAEQYGYDSAWLGDDIGGRDPFIALASWATATENIRLGVAVTNPYTRHPVSIAATAATLDECSNGRAILGIGTGASWRSLIADRWIKPVGYMKESIQVIRELWSVDKSTYRGVPVSLRDSLWVWPDAPPASFRKKIPLFMGTRGPQMTRLAARLSDGLVLEMCKFLSDIEPQVRSFRNQLAEFGRDPEQIDCAALIMVSVAGEGQDFSVVRRIVAFQISRLDETVAMRQGFDLRAFRQIKSVYAQHAGIGEVVKYGTEPAAWEAATYVTQEMLDAFGVTGTPDDCRRKLERYYQVGINLPLLMPLGCSVPLALEVGKELLQQT